MPEAQEEPERTLPSVSSQLNKFFLRVKVVVLMLVRYLTGKIVTRKFIRP